MYGSALGCPGLFQHLPMSWMSVDALRCPGCMSMITDVLDVCPCLLMTWMYIDLLIYSSKFLLPMYSDELRFLSANMFRKKIPISTTRYTSIYRTLFGQIDQKIILLRIFLPSNPSIDHSILSILNPIQNWHAWGKLFFSILKN